jgi:hypothetical protein
MDISSKAQHEKWSSDLCSSGCLAFLKFGLSSICLDLKDTANLN